MKIRILFTIPNFDTAGSGKALLNIAKGLNPDNFEVHILCKHNRGEFFNTVKSSGVPVHVFEYETAMRPILRGLYGCWKISRLIKKIKPDIVHSFHYSADYSEALASRLAGAKWVFTKKNMSWGGPSKNAWKVRSFLAKGIAVQNTDMIKQFYPNSNKIELIPRGVNLVQFQEKEADLGVKLSLSIPNEARIIICVANMVPVKGVELLIQAFASLESEFLNWYVLLVGDINSNYGESLITLTESYGLTKRIRFTGKQTNVNDYLNLAEIFVLPTKDEGRREGSPVALLEAMANGKIVIGSAVPGVKDQLQQFPQNQFEPGNWEDLREKLMILMQKSIEENKSQGKKFVKHVFDDYSLNLELKRHSNFYLKIKND